MEPKQERFVVQVFARGSDPRAMLLDNKGEWMTVGMSRPTASHNARVLNSLESRITELEQERDGLRLALEKLLLESTVNGAYSPALSEAWDIARAALQKDHEPVSKEAE